MRREQLARVEHRRPQVGRSVRERAVRAVLRTEAARVRIVHAHARFVVAQVVATLRVARRPVQEWAIVAILTDPRSFIIFGTIIISAIVKRSISFPYWPSSSLIIEMPMETCKRPMLCTLVL